MNTKPQFLRATQALDDAVASIGRFNTYIEPIQNDLVVLVLKGHLLIEEQLNGILTDSLHIAGFPKEIILEFSQKYYLVRQMLIDRPHKKVNADKIVPINSLNTMRNLMAHVILEEEAITDRVKNWLLCVVRATGWKPKREQSLNLQLKEALGIMYYFLCSARAFLKMGHPE